MQHDQDNNVQQRWLSLALSPMVVVRALKVAAVVGTVLALINHGDKIVDTSFSVNDGLKIAMTYLVPYCVSTWSAVGAIQARQSGSNQ